MLNHRFCKRLDIDHQTGSGNSIELKNTIDRKYANDVIAIINILCLSVLYKLITILCSRTPTIYLLFYLINFTKTFINSCFKIDNVLKVGCRF